MIDTGSEANIIKNHLLPSEIDMDNFKKVFLKGVVDKLNRSMGTIKLAVYGHKGFSNRGITISYLYMNASLNIFNELSMSKH